MNKVISKIVSTGRKINKRPPNQYRIYIPRYGVMLNDNHFEVDLISGKLAATYNSMIYSAYNHGFEYHLMKVIPSRNQRPVFQGDILKNGNGDIISVPIFKKKSDIDDFNGYEVIGNIFQGLTNKNV